WRSGDEQSRKPLVPIAVFRQFHAVMANRKLGCLTLFLFVALCASVILNIFLAIAVLGRVSTGAVREEPMTKFREIIVQRGGSGDHRQHRGDHSNAEL